MRLLLLSLLLSGCTTPYEHTPAGRAAGAARDNSIKLPQ